MRCLDGQRAIIKLGTKKKIKYGKMNKQWVRIVQHSTIRVRKDKKKNIEIKKKIIITIGTNRPALNMLNK